MIHPTADVQSTSLGDGTKVWQYSIILPDATIGKECNINCHVFIENDVVVGNYVTVKAGVQLWDGLRIGDNVFIGPNVTFTNDKLPRSKQKSSSFQTTVIESYASIGGGAVILGGNIIGSYAMVGAGAVVTKDVPERALVIGNPARIIGWVNTDGSKMVKRDNFFIDSNGAKWKVNENQLTKA
ncbi:acyltransferase [Rhodohalobacter sulfatireducens]|uniref:acyltransferase n=1 Tax=Rhodohalobacter sulfatireducens TaxID=2911366 RepID=UPI00272AAF82|nr:acyltransferase [Rhodohalobacter sulfatireducens]